MSYFVCPGSLTLHFPPEEARYWLWNINPARDSLGNIGLLGPPVRVAWRPNRTRSKQALPSDVSPDEASCVSGTWIHRSLPQRAGSSPQLPLRHAAVI